MKIVFFGTPYYIVPILEALHKSFRDTVGLSPISAVVTQAPKPTGRKQLLEYSPVDTWAHRKRVPIYFNSQKVINEKIDADVGILASFGEILTGSVINYFPKGIINIHPSILPKFRGASPVPATILFGEKETGITFTKMDEELDKGFIISQIKEDIYKDDNCETLRNRLFEKSIEPLIGLLPAYLKGKITPKPLTHEPGTFTWKMTKEHAFIPPGSLDKVMRKEAVSDKWKIEFINNFKVIPNAVILERFIRAMYPWPVAWTNIKIGKDVKRIRILKSHVEENALVLDEVQLEGKNNVSWKQFREGYKTATFE